MLSSSISTHLQMLFSGLGTPSMFSYEDSKRTSTGLAFFTKAVPSKTKALWKANGGRIVQTVPEFYEAAFAFCVGCHDPELRELLARQMLVRDIAWIEACISQDFPMPIAAYTLDENNLPDGDADTSLDSNSSSMTVVDETFAISPMAESKSNTQKPVLTETASKVVYASKGVLTRRLSGSRRMRFSSSHPRGASSLPKAQRKIRFSKTASTKASSSNVRKSLKPRIVRVVQEESSCSAPAMNSADGTPHLCADLSSGVPKSQITEAQPPATTDEANAFHEFMATIPQSLHRSADFQNLLTRAVNQGMARKSNPRPEDTTWKAIQRAGYRQSDGTLHLPIGHLLQVQRPAVVELNIGDVFHGRRFQISVS